MTDTPQQFPETTPPPDGVNVTSDQAEALMHADSGGALVPSGSDAENELLLQKTYLEILFNSAPEAIALHDNNDRIANINVEFTRLFGYTREEAIGRPINELLASEDFEDEARDVSERVMRGERIELETRRKRKDGTLVDVSILGSPIVHNGRQIGDYAIYRDITDRKIAEEARIRAREEARMARNIQVNFLPKTNPDLPGYDIAGRSIPAWNVGGDYFDFIPLDEHRLAVGLGDVSGKGLGAALVMANVQATIRSLTLHNDSPAACLGHANTLLYRSTDARTFVSLFFGVLDLRTHRFIFANAGQNLPILFSQGRAPAPLVLRGIALGITEDVAYEQAEVRLGHGDKLLAFSDGIPEAMNSAKEEYGDARIVNAVRRSWEAPAAVGIDALIRSVSTHIGDESECDDITAVLLHRL
ncbi:MAG: SpoIIE family protein phosphatase [Ignavibacteria bacterium]|nr:SpoIIE family protein phosphatase [Ignavibacteria bacterium]